MFHSRAVLIRKLAKPHEAYYAEGRFKTYRNSLFFCVIYGVLYVDVLYFVLDYILMKILAKEEKSSHTFRYFGALVFKYSKGFVVIHGRDIGEKVARNIKGTELLFYLDLTSANRLPKGNLLPLIFLVFSS